MKWKLKCLRWRLNSLLWKYRVADCLKAVAKVTGLILAMLWIITSTALSAIAPKGRK